MFLPAPVHPKPQPITRLNASQDIILLQPINVMCQIHPTDGGSDGGEVVMMRDDGPSVWTVWKKSSMAFKGTDGFSIYDSQGRLAFRVDNYSRRHKYFAGELILMDGKGTALLALRPQILSMHDRWSGFRIKDGLETGSELFSMRRRAILQSGDEAEVFVGGPSHQPQVPSFRVEGCFRRRCCKIRSSKGEVVANISRKKVNASVILDDDVFSLTIQPGVDHKLMMALVVIMDRICHKPFTPVMCY